MRISDWSSDVCSSDLQIFRNGSSLEVKCYLIKAGLYHASHARALASKKRSQDPVAKRMSCRRIYNGKADLDRHFRQSCGGHNAAFGLNDQIDTTAFTSCFGVAKSRNGSVDTPRR